jgi:pimeloyl-ACP methyl ester carboxylesterase
VIPAETPRELSSRIAHAQLRVVPGRGHMLPLEAPDVVARALVDLVAGADAHHGS